MRSWLACWYVRAAHEVVWPTRAVAKYGRKTGTAAACVAARTLRGVRVLMARVG